MPATAGWVRMPQSNRVAVSASLRTHAIWTESVGYDPYAPEKQQEAAAAEDALKDKAKELLTLARLTGTLSTHTPGACTKCNQGASLHSAAVAAAVAAAVVAAAAAAIAAAAVPFAGVMQPS